jgi:hypothetical protein
MNLPTVACRFFGESGLEEGLFKSLANRSAEHQFSMMYEWDNLCPITVFQNTFASYEIESKAFIVQRGG